MLSLSLLLLLLFSPLIQSRFTDVSGHNPNVLEVGGSRFRRDSPPISLENHIYYTSSFYTGDTFSDTWYELANMNTSTFHTQLSDGYYLYDPVKLQFKFPFYGHYLESVAITTHGFLSTADILHDSIYLTQYIAPLSADFNPSLSPNSKIYYLSLPDLFVVQWSNLFLDTTQRVAGFTFQTQLRPSGEITFAYKTVPLTVRETSKPAYRSVSGLADGFILNNGGSLYLYSYHNVTLPDTRNLTRSVYVLTPLPNCIAATDKDSCNVTSCSSSFDCGWCESLSLCSDGLDRMRQEWYESDCHNTAVFNCLSGAREASSSPAPVVVVVVVVVVALLVIILATILLTIPLVYAVYRYRKGGRFWIIRNQVLPKSDKLILRDSEDAGT